MATFGDGFISAAQLLDDSVTNAKMANDAIKNAEVASDAAIALSKLAALTSTQIIVGNGSNVAAAVAVTGDVTISNAGVTAIASNVVVNADVKTDAAIDYSKLAALTDGNILVGNGSNVAVSVNPSGDVDISNAGVFSIASDVIIDADVKTNAAIAFSKMASSTDISSTGTVTDLTIASEAQGDVLYFNGTNWVRLAPGTAGTFLKTNGAAANPSWAGASVVLARGVIAVDATAVDGDFVDVTIPVSTYAAGDTIIIDAWHLNGQTSKNMQVATQIRDTTSAPTAATRVLTENNAVYAQLHQEIMQDATSDDIALIRTVIWRSSDPAGVETNSIERIDTNDAGFIATAWTLRINFFWSSAPGAAENVGYNVKVFKG